MKKIFEMKNKKLSSSNFPVHFQYLEKTELEFDPEKMEAFEVKKYHSNYCIPAGGHHTPISKIIDFKFFNRKGL